MKQIVLSCTLVLTALAAYGCSEDRPSPTEPTGLQAAFSKHAGEGETNPMAIWEWKKIHSAGLLSAIRGDGRDWDGTTLLTADSLTGVYQGAVCGVRATIFWSGTNYGGDAVFDPDLDMKGSKCGPRSITLDGQSQSEAPFMNVFGIMYVPRSNESQYKSDDTQAYSHGGRLQWLRIINRTDKTCERLQWGVPTESTEDEHWRAQTAGILVTRLSGSYAKRGSETDGYGQWEVKTVGDHTATCYAWSQGAYRPTVPARTYNLPFRVTITELPSTGGNGPNP